MKGLKQLAIVSLAASMSCYAWGSSNGGVGVVDLKEVFASPDAAPKIQASLEKRFSSERDQLQKLLDDLQSQQKSYQKDKKTLSKTALAKREEKFKEAQEKFQKEQGKYQQEFAAAQNKAMTRLLSQIKDAARKVAKKDHLKMVLVKNTVLYAEDTKDVTDAVVDKINH